MFFIRDPFAPLVDPCKPSQARATKVHLRCKWLTQKKHFTARKNDFILETLLPWRKETFPPPQFLFCFLVLSSKPSAHTQRLDGWIVHNCKNTQLFLDVIERRHLVQDWHGTAWNVNLHLHCWHIFLKVWAKSSGGRKPFIPEMPAAWRQFLFILKGLQERWKEASSFYLGADWYCLVILFLSFSHLLASAVMDKC